MNSTTIAHLTLLVDTEDEAPARAIAARFLAQTGCWVSAQIWKPYPKLGPHSRLEGRIRLAGADPIAAAEAVLGLAITPEGLDGGYRRHAVLDDGSCEYNRIFDWRTSPFRDLQLLWIDLEFSTYPEVQKKLEQDARFWA